MLVNMDWSHIQQFHGLIERDKEQIANCGMSMWLARGRFKVSWMIKGEGKEVNSKLWNVNVTC